MGQALYRKYRSKSLDEIVGQEHITDTLRRALKAGKVSHAYLFTGPRGVGKTSIARILAYELNGLPYDENGGHIDIIEIDAASNNGVEDVRDLREKVYVAPAQAKYKVYIIDEVHMLSKAAFNALLKTLEEPPAHVVFILATTEAHKLPETIVSRTQRFVFRPIDPDKAREHLKTLAKAEQIGISDEALDLIVQHGDGSFRDSISLLDQLSGKGSTIGLDDVQSVLGIAPDAAIRQLLDAVATAKPTTDIYQQLRVLLEQGYQPAAIAKQLAAAVRSAIVRGAAVGDRPAELLTALLEVPVSHDPEAHLEVSLLTLTGQAAPTPPQLAPEPSTALQKATPAKAAKPKKPEPTPTAEAAPATTNSAAEIEPIPAVPESDTPVPPEAASAVLDGTNWQQVLNILKKQHNTLYGIVRMAQPDFDTAGTLTLAFNFAFHQKRANEAKNRKAISDAVVAVAGAPIEIVCIHDPAAVPPKVVAPVATLAPDSGSSQLDSLGNISNIFGGGELLQSD